MQRYFWLIAAPLAFVATLRLLRLASRLRGAKSAEGAAGQGMSTRSIAASPLKGHPLFAATYDTLTRGSETRLLSQFRSRIAGLATGRVLEIGAGTGANLPYYRAVEQLVAVEPDPYMLQRARRRAAQLRLKVEFHGVPAEALPFPDASFDTVVATLVLCTVSDPAQALAEVRRVLRPGGTFRFIEHVRAEGGLLARLQDLLTPLWQRVAAGCHLNRPTAQSIRAAGFEIVDLEQRALPMSPLVVGVAKPRQR